MNESCTTCPVADHVAGAASERPRPPASARVRGTAHRSAIPGVSSADLVRLLGPVSPASSPPDSSAEAEDRFARAALSTAVDPGDLDAGALVDSLGAVGLLGAIAEGLDARQVLDRAFRAASDGPGDDSPPADELSGTAAAVPDDPGGQEGEATALAWKEAREALASALHDGPIQLGSPEAREALLSALNRGGSEGAPSPGEPLEHSEPTPPDLRQNSAGELRWSAETERRLARCLDRWRPRLSVAEAARSLERTARIGATLLTPDSPFWPGGFAALERGAPLALWIRGDPARFRRLDRSIALVGARAATGYGEHVAMESAAGLADRGFAIVSGGAYGIDAAAHRATLASGGVTVAFMAGGADRLYPAGNRELLQRIIAQGVLAAELPPGSTPTRWRFLMRNRLIAAAATATVVIEAGHRSGSLNTAGHTAQMGRPLGAVPGSILSPASAGCHRLIREYAATCVTTAEEMAELADPLGTGPADDPAASAAAAGRDGPERSVLVALSRSGAASADEIAARADLPFATVAAILGRLDLAGRARESAGGWTLIEKKRV